MRTGTDVLHETDWSRLLHARGTATDAPKALAPLLDWDEAGWRGALDYLYEAVLGGGGVHPATAPAALFVAGLLDHPVADTVPPWAGPWPRTLRGVLLEFLGAAARAASTDPSDEEPGTAAEVDATRAVYAAVGRRAVLDLRAVAPALYDAVRPYLTDDDRHVRQRAVEAAGEFAFLAGLEPDLSGAADMAGTRDEGAAIVLALGRNGRDTTAYLTHADPAIRACAALAPALRGDPCATGELVSALLRGEEIESWFSVRPGAFGGPVRSSLARELRGRARVGDRADLLAVARVMVEVTEPESLAADLSPYGALFEPVDGARWRAEDLTALHREYLRVLVDSERLWERADEVSRVSRRAWEEAADQPYAPAWRRLSRGELRRFLDAHGLPQDREELRALAEE
ncbi:hypothetical protein BJF83_12415 [Nocardiopsis sp. CNR-923]|uniref:hypothetical protein n=1 Tax=Nocardiopsis sp. CNR-923 TaxID=1904965 RepID=UPI00095BA3A3|nr:hypothetical protein [Nocardiopsis sp. CNR-923]OLT29240.1 hypothetical protein BJF83_12415 [Nocardiopsis sp. CNR-923]